MMMPRSTDERIADVRRLLRAAREVHAHRARHAADVARATGLTREGVELGFASLERDASDEDLHALVAAAGDAPRVHVILAANVFVAPLRALAIARAAAPHVTVRPSSRDPVLTRALVDAALDAAVTLVDPRDTPDRDVASLDRGEIHVYGRDETLAAVRAAAQDPVVVRGHGAGIGVAVVTRAADSSRAAEGAAADVVPFDQRGCLSPRVVLVEGDAARAKEFASALDEQLRAWGERVPRGILDDSERAEATRWVNATAFAGDLWRGPHHAVALLPGGPALAIPPAGRHVLVAAVPTLDAVAFALAPIARFVVAVGADDLAAVAGAVPRQARLSALGRMQHPPLDGPVDHRPQTAL
jgi:hypothetical protein